MDNYQKRFYRGYHISGELISYQVTIDESDLYIASTLLSDIDARIALNKARNLIKKCISLHPLFFSSLIPLDIEYNTPPVSWMLEAAQICSVGPMAAVAGAVSRYVGEALLEKNNEVIVENGGDIFISSKSPRKVMVYAGESPVSMNIAIEVPAGTYGICTSAGKVGPSLSFGKADAAIVLSRDCALADAAATQLGNLAKNESDIEAAVSAISSLPGILGAMAVYNDKIAVKGEIKLTGV
ncbi:MAG: UPF0280 family protein [Clostridia bacterium]|nr:UPF0280 family protein [Clostridia bacterium]